MINNQTINLEPATHSVFAVSIHLPRDQDPVRTYDNKKLCAVTFDSQPVSVDHASQAAKPGIITAFISS